MTEGHVYAVASGKGGVGKTTTAVNLGAAFVEAGRSVVVVDVDLGMANLGDFLDVGSVETTLHDVLAGEASIDEAVVSAPGDFDAVVGSPGLEDYGRADPANLRGVVDDLRERYDVVVLDGGGGLSHDVTVPLGIADGVIVVTTPADAAITNAELTTELVERIGGTVEGMIVTRIGGAGRATPEVVSDRLDLSVLGAVPEDGAIQMSMDEGTPLVSIDRESPAAQSYREIAYSLLGEPLPRDWVEESEDPVGTSVPADPAPESSEPASGETTPEGTADSPAVETPAAESAEPAGTDLDDAEPEDTPAAGIAERLETMEDEPAGDEATAGESDAGGAPPTEDVVAVESGDDGETRADLDTGEDETNGTDDGDRDDVDVVPGPTKSTSEDAGDSSGGGSFIARLFGGLFG
ncbi:MAG: P-loop NTPase [Halodesulfurarchaeum sp.]|nr:P-loop NTPase [Halodesulfurarchaeum sp.]